MATVSPTIADENRAAAGATFSPAEAIAGEPVVRERSGGIISMIPWSLAAIAVGMVTLGACVLVPLHEDNRQLAHQLDAMRAEGDFVRQQVAANGEFIARVHTDPALAERLVMRATRRPAAGKQFLDDAPVGTFGSSPYAITQLAPPPPQAEYRTDLPPVLGSLFADAHSRVILMGAGVFLVGASVILGGRKEQLQKAK